MTQEALKQMYQLLLTEPHAPTVCAQLERIAREALAEHAMRETQRLGQEIEQCKYPDCKCPTENPCLKGLAQPEQEPVADYIAARDMLDAKPVPPRTWIGLEGAEAGWFCHTDFLNARKYTKKQREYICNQLLSEAQSWDIDQYIRMMHDSTKLKETT